MLALSYDADLIGSSPGGLTCVLKRKVPPFFGVAFRSGGLLKNVNSSTFAAVAVAADDEDDAALLVPLVLLLVLFLSSLPHAASHSASPPAPAMPAPLSSCRRASRVRPKLPTVAAMS